MHLGAARGGDPGTPYLILQRRLRGAIPLETRESRQFPWSRLGERNQRTHTAEACQAIHNRKLLKLNGLCAVCNRLSSLRCSTNSRR
jgi:hypothetical protein